MRAIPLASLLLIGACVQGLPLDQKEEPWRAEPPTRTLNEHLPNPTVLRPFEAEAWRRHRQQKRGSYPGTDLGARLAVGRLEGPKAE